MGKTALVLGVANQRSIAWACVKSLLEKDFQVIFTYQNERFSKRIESLIESQKKDTTTLLCAVPCDVWKRGEIPKLFDKRLPKILGEKNEATNKIDAIIHCIAYAPADAMKGGSLLQTSRQSFLKTHDISTYSFLEIARCAVPRLSEGASLTAFSYIGAMRAVPNYNVMGPAKASLESLARGLAIELAPQRLRVNVISSGPLNTLAARGIGGFSAIKSEVEERAPLQKTLTVDDVARTARFIATEATGMTGQTIYIDGGYSTVAGPPLSLNIETK